ncbi:MAG: ABC transporter permease [Acidobacteria bacterium]|nr:ABC transporter permease [Acidobacteriota bacterium]
MLAQDLRYALRTLVTQKAFAAVVVVCLGLGIGVNATIFSVADGVLIQPFPYAEPHRLVVMNATNREADVDWAGLSYLDVRDWRAQSTRLSSIATTSGRSLTLSDGGEPVRYRGEAVSWDLFPMLGITPIVGRPFGPGDDAVGAPDVVLLSEEVWRLRYQSDPAAIGRRVLINSKPHEIIGVMPKGFKFPEIAQLWVPATPLVHAQPRDNRSLEVYARLADGATVAQADEEARAIAARLAEAFPGTHKGWSAWVHDLRDELIPTDVSLVIWLMMGAATLVLIIACSNVANLLLARATVRRREISVRAALGAGRGRIIRQLLTESVVFGVISVPLGLALAYAGTQLLTAAMPPDQIPYYIQWRIDWRSVSYAVVVAVVTAVVFGLVPAFQATGGTLHDELKEGTRGNSGTRSLARNALVVVQVALAIVSLVGAALFVRTFVNLDDYEVGFDPAPLMTFRTYLPADVYSGPDAVTNRVRDLVERLEGLPGVEAVFASAMVPLGGGGGGGSLHIDGVSFESGREPYTDLYGVTPGFLKTLGLAVTDGEDFTAAQGWSRTPVALVNRTLVNRYFAASSPIGRRVRVTESGNSDEWLTIIGVIEDIKHDEIDPDDETYPAIYVPYPYQESFGTGVTMRVAGEPSAVMPAVRAQVRAADADLPIYSVLTMDARRRLSFWQFAIFGWVFSIIGVIALLLSAVGVYGVLSYSVSQRTREIGVRVALGASAASVQTLIVRQGVILAGVGVVLGLAASAALTQKAVSLLYNVAPTDPLSYTVVAVFLLLVAGLASWVPARRAMRVDPIEALRGE